jgi:hypothetical protein
MGLAVSVVAVAVAVVAITITIIANCLLPSEIGPYRQQLSLVVQCSPPTNHFLAIPAYGGPDGPVGGVWMVQESVWRLSVEHTGGHCVSAVGCGREKHHSVVEMRCVRLLSGAGRADEQMRDGSGAELHGVGTSLDPLLLGRRDDAHR